MTRRRGVFRLAAGPRRAEHDLDAELEFHLAMRVRRLVDAGMSPADARTHALERFGDLAAVRSECLIIDRERDRAMRRAIRFADLRHDAAYAVRSLAKRPGFTAVLLLILALGIGANAATFTLVNALLLRPLPVRDADRLVTIGAPWRTGSFSEGTPRADLFSYPLFADVRDGNRVLAGVYATGRADRLDVLLDRDSTGALRAGGEAEHPRGRFVSGSYFSVLGVPAALGRTFTAAEDRAPGSDPYVVVSHTYWQRRLGGDRAAVGRTMVINGMPLTIVGVAPAGFTGDIIGQPIEVWIPVMMQPALMPHGPWLEARDKSWLLLMGRLAPGVTIEQARAALRAVVSRSLLDHAKADDAVSIANSLRDEPPMIEPGARGFSYYRKTYASALLTLSVAVGLVLLVICANVANLLLARASARGREISVRMALGAGRRRVVQQLLVESVVLAVAGGALGLVVAMWGSTALVALASANPGALPIDARLDPRVFAFVGVLVAATALLFGLAPALHATRAPLASALRSRGITGAERAGGGRAMPLGKLLVVAQIALSTLLLVSTGMLVRSTTRLEHADLGLARDSLLVAQVDLARAGYDGPRRLAMLRTLSDHLARLPGVSAVTYSENGIFSGTESASTLQVESYRAHADSDTLVAYDDVGPGFAHTIGAHLLRGRDFDASDNESGARVAIIDQSMARFFFPHDDPIGRHLMLDSASVQVVGIVADVQGQGVRDAAGRRFYVPMAQRHDIPEQPRLIVRATGDPARLVPAVRRALRAADPAIAVMNADALDDLVRDSISQDRLVSRVVTLFGGLALVLASLGLYGVIAYAAVRRTNEFGLRMALGADRGTVTRLVLGEAMWLLCVGLLVGLPAAAAATRLLRDQLFGVDLLDLPSIAVAVAMLGVSAALAALLPALRASRVAPLEALRSD